MQKAANSENWLSTVPIAHRGLHGRLIVENTLEAFDAAIKKGFAIEIDVRLSLDGEVFVFHDDDFMRICGVNGSVESFTAAHIQSLTTSRAASRIPTLKEVLDFVDGSAPILVELKRSRNRVAFVDAVLDCAHRYVGRIAFQSFDPVTLFHLKRRTHCPIGFLSKKFTADDGIGIVSGHISSQLWPLRVLRVDFVAYELNSITPAIVETVRSRGVTLVTWTIATPCALEKARKLGANVIFEGIEP